jgi:acyl-coenzyme A thioesterase PaaI-like protein
MSAVTAEMTVRYKKPAAIGRRLVLEGWVVDRSRKVVHCASVLRDASGTEIASGQGKLIVKSSPHPGRQL